MLQHGPLQNARSSTRPPFIGAVTDPASFPNPLESTSVFPDAPLAPQRDAASSPVTPRVSLLSALGALIKPSRMLLDVGKQFFLERVLRGDAEFEYFRNYSNGASHFAPLNDKVRKELSGILKWLNTEESNLRVGYFSGLCILGERTESRGFQYQRLHPAPAFAKAVLEFYRHSSQGHPEIQRALDDVETFFEQSGKVDYQAGAWWLLTTMVDRRDDPAELCKALGECTAMTLVARTLDTGNPLLKLVVQAAKERQIVEGEALIPSFDFRVHAVTPSVLPRTNTPRAFFEVKRVQSLRSANDITSVVRSTVTNKLEKPYPERDGVSAVLETHPALKVLVIQAPWPTPTRPFHFRTKSQLNILSSDGTMERGYERNGTFKLTSSGSMFGDIAAKLCEIRGAEKLDAVFLTNHSGELVQTFYRQGRATESGVLLTKSASSSHAAWRSEGVRQIDPLSYLPPVAK